MSSEGVENVPSRQRATDGALFKVGQRVSFIDPQSGIYTDGVVVCFHGNDQVEVGYHRSGWSDPKYNRIVSIFTLLTIACKPPRRMNKNNHESKRPSNKMEVNKGTGGLPPPPSDSSSSEAPTPPPAGPAAAASPEPSSLQEDMVVDEPQPSPSHSSSSSVDGSPRPIMPGSDGPSFLVGQRDTTEDATTRSATPTRAESPAAAAVDSMDGSSAEHATEEEDDDEEEMMKVEAVLAENSHRSKSPSHQPATTSSEVQCDSCGEDPRSPVPPDQHNPNSPRNGSDATSSSSQQPQGPSSSASPSPSPAMEQQQRLPAEDAAPPAAALSGDVAYPSKPATRTLSPVQEQEKPAPMPTEQEQPQPPQESAPRPAATSPTPDEDTTTGAAATTSTDRARSPSEAATASVPAAVSMVSVAAAASTSPTPSAFTPQHQVPSPRPPTFTSTYPGSSQQFVASMVVNGATNTSVTSLPDLGSLSGSTTAASSNSSSSFGTGSVGGMSLPPSLAGMDSWEAARVMVELRESFLRMTAGFQDPRAAAWQQPPMLPLAPPPPAPTSFHHQHHHHHSAPMVNPWQQPMGMAAPSDTGSLPFKKRKWQ